MKLVRIKTPCGGTFDVRPENVAARKAQLDKDHAEGRGCHLCKPASTPQPEKGYGESLLDHGKKP